MTKYGQWSEEREKEREGETDRERERQRASADVTPANQSDTPILLFLKSEHIDLCQLTGAQKSYKSVVEFCNYYCSCISRKSVITNLDHSTCISRIKTPD